MGGKGKMSTVAGVKNIIFEKGGGAEIFYFGPIYNLARKLLRTPCLKLGY